MSEPLSKVDSAVQGLSSSPKEEQPVKKAGRRQSSLSPDVMNIADLGKLPEALDTPRIAPTDVGLDVNSSHTDIVYSRGSRH